MLFTRYTSGLTELKTHCECSSTPRGLLSSFLQSPSRCNYSHSRMSTMGPLKTKTKTQKLQSVSQERRKEKELRRLCCPDRKSQTASSPRLSKTSPPANYLLLSMHVCFSMCVCVCVCVGVGLREVVAILQFKRGALQVTQAPDSHDSTLVLIQIRIILASDLT